MAKAIRGENGKFLPSKATVPAIFSSVGKGTCNMTKLVITMVPGKLNREKGGINEKGKRIEFRPKGKYETYDTEEIQFLKEKEKNPKPFSRIICVQEPEYKESDE